LPFWAKSCQSRKFDARTAKDYGMASERKTQLRQEVMELARQTTIFLRLTGSPFAIGWIVENESRPVKGGLMQPGRAATPGTNTLSLGQSPESRQATLRGGFPEVRCSQSGEPSAGPRKPNVRLSSNRKSVRPRKRGFPRNGQVVDPATRICLGPQATLTERSYKAWASQARRTANGDAAAYTSLGNSCLLRHA
jgi:hypothetical protein